jgi:hypothetical protein
MSQFRYGLAGAVRPQQRDWPHGAQVMRIR